MNCNNLCCAAMIQRPANSGGMSAWDERVRRSVSLGQKLAPTDSPRTDGQSGKTTNSSGVKTVEMIPEASGHQIECGLFLWLSSDVRRLLNVLDVP